MSTLLYTWDMSMLLYKANTPSGMLNLTPHFWLKTLFLKLSPLIIIVCYCISSSKHATIAPILKQMMTKNSVITLVSCIPKNKWLKTTAIFLAYHSEGWTFRLDLLGQLCCGWVMHHGLTAIWLGGSASGHWLSVLWVTECSKPRRWGDGHT